MKSILIALGMAAAFMTTAAHSSPLTAAGSTTSFSSVQNASVSASKGKKHSSKHNKAKRAHRAAKKA